MKIAINTAIDPHFIALVDDDLVIVEIATWDIPKYDGEKIYDFLKKNISRCDDISDVFIISGPGGFSSLRAGQGVAKALAFKYGLKIKPVLAFDIAADIFDGAPFALRSFGARVWGSDRELYENLDLAEAKLGKLRLDFLPNQTTEVSAELICASLVKNGMKVDGVERFEPWYGVAAV